MGDYDPNWGGAGRQLNGHTEYSIDWNGVNEDWTLVNGGNLGITGEAGIGLTGGLLSALGKSPGGQSASALVGTWAASTWFGAILGNVKSEWVWNDPCPNE